MTTPYTNTELFLANTTNNSGTINLPAASSIPGRVLEFKDSNGTFNTKTLTLVCSGSDTFEDGSSTKVLNTKFGSIQLVASGSKWYLLNGIQVNTFQVSSLTTFAISTFTTNTSSINVSSLALIDNRNSTNTLYTSTSFLLYNNFIISGTRVGYSNIINKFTFTPYLIPNLALWLDATDSRTIIQSGGSVSQWNDKTNNIAFTPQGTQSFLTVVPNSIQNNQSLYFNNTSGENVALLGSFNQPSNFCLFVVWKNLTQISGAYRNIFGWQFVSTPTPGAFNFGYVGTQTGTNISLWDTKLGQSNTTLAVTNNTNYFGYSQYPAASLSINGNTPSVTTLNVNSNAPNLYIGGLISANQTVSIYIGEIILYNRVVTTFERQQIEGYLAWKWGLQGNLPANHPYKNAPP